MHLSAENLVFVTFLLFVLGVLMVDLLLVGRKSHIVSFKESLIWTSIWVSCALVFYFIILHYGEKLHGITDIEGLKAIALKYAPHLKFTTSNFGEALQIYRSNIATEFITGYLMEYTLSVDNIFVIMLILAGFSVEAKEQKHVLFWGIIGAVVLRCVFIFTGAALIERFEWILLVFGAFLVYSGIKVFIDRNGEDSIEVSEHWLVKFLSGHFSITPNFVGGKFVTRINGKMFLTPLLVVLLLVEITDIIFALDSVPAIFAVTRDPYIVFFSNIFAIIGLRSLFFLLAKAINIFHYLKVGVSFLLVFIGFKLLLHTWLYDIGFKNSYSLLIIITTLAISILASLIWPARQES